MKNTKETAWKVNWVLLGLVMLIPGLLKLFVMKPAAIVGMLTGIGIPAPTLFAWVLIIGEILSGVLILGRWKLEKVVYIPIIVLLVAAFTVHWANWTNMLVHFALAANFWVLGSHQFPKK
jgi:uncharacterized membrane protein YphA (DoxX/SURF4 family)